MAIINHVLSMQKIFVWAKRALEDKYRSFMNCDCMNILAGYSIISAYIFIKDGFIEYRTLI